MNKNTAQRSAAAGRDYAGQTIAERRQARREALVSAGVQVFGTHGFRAATVKAICRQAGLTERYFYESFANSEALFATVYKSLTSRLETEMLAAVDAVTVPAEAQADLAAEAMSRAALAVYFRHMADPQIARILLIEIFGISAKIDRTYRATTLEFARMTEELTARIFEPAALRLGGSNPRLVAIGLVGSTIHIAMYWNLNGYREPLEEVIASALAVYQAVGRSLRPRD